MSIRSILPFFFLITTFSACQEQSVSILDYYYPLQNIEEYQIYQYEKRIRGKEEDAIETSYVKIGRIEGDSYYFLTLNDSMVILDSAIMRIDNGSIFVQQLYLHDTGVYLKGVEENQQLYPANVVLNEHYSAKHTFDSIKISDQSTRASTVFDLYISKMTDSAITVQMHTKTSLNSNESDTKFTFVEESTILNKKGIGLYSESMRGQEFKSYKKLIRIWAPLEWEEHLSDLANQNNR